MSIDKNFGRSASEESLSNAVEAELCAPESPSESERKLAEVIEAIKGEFA